ncbi:hypothetical protein BJX64DRAFT_31492 [Aspergillus heterothallicus]
MLSWFLARHVFYIIILRSTWADVLETIPKGCYHGAQTSLVGPIPPPTNGWAHLLEPFWKPSGMICYSAAFHSAFLVALGFLQLLIVIWFVLIVRVAVRVVKGLGADDIRSDNEGEDEAGIDVDVDTKPRG